MQTFRKLAGLECSGADLRQATVAALQFGKMYEVLYRQSEMHLATVTRQNICQSSQQWKSQQLDSKIILYYKEKLGEKRASFQTLQASVTRLNVKFMTV